MNKTHTNRYKIYSLFGSQWTTDGMVQNTHIVKESLHTLHSPVSWMLFDHNTCLVFFCLQEVRLQIVEHRSTINSHVNPNGNPLVGGGNLGANGTIRDSVSMRTLSRYHTIFYGQTSRVISSGVAYQTYFHVWTTAFSPPPSPHWSDLPQKTKQYKVF